MREPADRGQRVTRVGLGLADHPDQVGVEVLDQLDRDGFLGLKVVVQAARQDAEAAATSRIDVLAYPSRANNPAAARRISSRRRFRRPSGALGTEDGDAVTRSLCGRRSLTAEQYRAYPS